MENYNPTRREIINEVFNNLKSVFTKQSLSEYSHAFAAGIMLSVVVPYMIPTSFRGFKEADKSLKEQEKYSASKRVFTSFGKAGAISGLATGCMVDGAQMKEYITLIINDEPKYLLIPVMTNLISGLYEIGRSQYIGAKQRLTKHNSAGLEERL